MIRISQAVGVTSYLWLATWFLQVMPIFFFVGGFSNYVTYVAYRERGESSWAFVRSRLDRLLRPRSSSSGSGRSSCSRCTRSGSAGRPGRNSGATTPSGASFPGATLPFGPLWFLAVYLVVVALAPFTIRLHRRFGLRVPA